MTLTGVLVHEIRVKLRLISKGTSLFLVYPSASCVERTEIGKSVGEGALSRAHESTGIAMGIQ